MKENKELALFSTLANDRLYYEKENLRINQKGGPALFISKAFDSANIKYDFRLAPKINVDILINEKGEFGKIPGKPIIVKINYGKIESPNILISTILDEICLDGIEKYRGKIFLDIQGYVRDGSDFGKKKKWAPAQGIIDAIFCLKATEQEIRYLPKKFIEKQKKKILILTKGSRGSDLFIKGKRFDIKPNKIVDSVNAIGAGDTFFAYFICEYLRSKDAKKSLEYSSEKVIEFLTK